MTRNEKMIKNVTNLIKSSKNHFFDEFFFGPY
jgi:hypothetical protein